MYRDAGSERRLRALARFEDAKVRAKRLLALTASLVARSAVISSLDVIGAADFDATTHDALDIVETLLDRLDDELVVLERAANECASRATTYARLGGVHPDAVPLDAYLEAPPRGKSHARLIELLRRRAYDVPADALVETPEPIAENTSSWWTPSSGPPPGSHTTAIVYFCTSSGAPFQLAICVQLLEWELPRVEAVLRGSARKTEEPITVRPQTVGDVVFSEVGLRREVKLHDHKFDSLFFVTGDADEVRSMLNEDVRAMLVSASDRDSVWLQVERGLARIRAGNIPLRTLCAVLEALAEEAES
jgi:hypothetical protein